MPLFPASYYKPCLCQPTLPVPRRISLDDCIRVVCRECYSALEVSASGRMKVIDECRIYTKCLDNIKIRNTMNIERNSKKKSPQNTHTFITIALPEYDYQNIEKLLKSKIKYLKEGIFTHEFFSGEDSHANPHIHVLIRKVIEKSRIIRDLSRMFKVKGNFIDIRYGDDQDYDNRTNYLNGTKIDETKQHNCTLDNEHREKLKIKSLYKI